MAEDEFHCTVEDANQPDIVTYGTMGEAHVALPLDLPAVDLSCSVAGLPDRAEYCANEMLQNGVPLTPSVQSYLDVRDGKVRRKKKGQRG